MNSATKRTRGGYEDHFAGQGDAVVLDSIDLRGLRGRGSRAAGGRRQFGATRRGRRHGDPPIAERQCCPAVSDRSDAEEPGPAGRAADQRSGGDRAGLPYQQPGGVGQREHRHPGRCADHRRGDDGLLSRRSAAAEAERLRLRLPERHARACLVRRGPDRSAARPAGNPVRRQL